MSNNFGHRVAPDNSYYAFTRGTEDLMRFGGANGDNSGQLAGFRNVLINGKININQRGVTIAAAAIGSYGPDRWKKVDASNMTQIVEDGNYKYSSVYTLSGIGVTTQQVTSPASGHWTMPSIPITATYVQLELGSIATPFENRPIGLEGFLCQRYLPAWVIPGGVCAICTGQAYSSSLASFTLTFPLARTAPTGASVVGLTGSINSTGAAQTNIALTFGNATASSMSLNATTSGLVSGNASVLVALAAVTILGTGCEL